MAHKPLKPYGNTMVGEWFNMVGEWGLNENRNGNQNGNEKTLRALLKQ